MSERPFPTLRDALNWHVAYVAGSSSGPPSPLSRAIEAWLDDAAGPPWRDLFYYMARRQGRLENVSYLRGEGDVPATLRSVESKANRDSFCAMIRKRFPEVAAQWLSPDRHDRTQRLRPPTAEQRNALATLARKFSRIINRWHAQWRQTAKWLASRHPYSGKDPLEQPQDGWFTPEASRLRTAFKHLLAQYSSEGKRSRTDNLSLADARRIALVTALLSDRSFDPTRIGLKMTWGAWGKADRPVNFPQGTAGRYMARWVELEAPAAHRLVCWTKIGRAAMEVLASHAERTRTAKSERTTPQQPRVIRAIVAVQRYEVTRKTLRLAVSDGRLTDYRPQSHARNAPLLVDEDEVSDIWAKRL